jgi:iron complex outermembrane recepter protein
VGVITVFENLAITPSVVGRGVALAGRSTVFAALILSVPLLGVAADETSDELQEVVVTARFTGENIQRTPLAISSISGEQIEARGLTQVQDVGASVPNVTFEPLGDHYGKGVTAYIRGVGQQDSGPTWSPAVGFYIDDVYVSSLAGSNIALLDVASVDVLRGPQGTLFGANTESGAVVIHSVAPQGDNSGFMEFGYGSYNHQVAKGVFDIPIIADKLFFRAGFYSEKQDGFQNLVDFACRYPALSGSLPSSASPLNNCVLGQQGGTDVQGAKMALLWKAADNLNVTLRADVTHDTGETPATTLTAVIPSPFTSITFPTNARFGIPFDSRFVSPNIYTSYENYTDPITGRHFDPVAPAFVYNVSGIVDWDALPSVNVKSITAYRSTDTSATDGFGTPLPFIMSLQTIYVHQITEEVHIGGKALADALEWTVGGFYLRSIGILRGDIDAPLLPSGEFVNRGTAITQNESGFVHGIYHFTDALSLEAGIRYTSVEKSYNLEQYLYPSYVLQFPTTTTNSPVSRGDPKVALQYQWTDSFMTYASYATGFKSGGVNPEVIYSVKDETPFGPETMKDYEIGEKSEWLDHRIRFNADAFLMHYDGLQVQSNRTLTVAPFAQSLVENVGSARVDGVELEFEARPFAALLFNASGGFLDYRTLSCGSACISNGGTVAPNAIAPETPRWKGNVGTQYALNAGEYGSITPRIDWTYQSKIFNDIQNTPLGAQDGYGVANFHLMWTDVSDKWSANLAVTNLADKVFYTAKYVFSLGAITGNPGAPREVLFTLRRQFR